MLLWRCYSDAGLLSSRKVVGVVVPSLLAYDTVGTPSLVLLSNYKLVIFIVIIVVAIRSHYLHCCRFTTLSVSLFSLMS